MADQERAAAPASTATTVGATGPATSGAAGVRAFHARPAGDAAGALGVDSDRGLSSTEAARRLLEHGANELSRERPPAPLVLLVRQFRDVMVIVLLVAIALSVSLGHVVESIAIGIITTFTVTLGFVQELRAQRALDALRRLAAPSARVLRDGAVTAVPARDVVPGDIVVVAEGDLVPADGRLVEAFGLRVAEASLTGESVPVDKRADVTLPASTELGDRINLVFASTAVAAGRGRAIITATGDGTEVGHVGRLLASVQAGKTPLERQLARLAKWLVRVGALLVLSIVLLGIARGQPVGDMLLFGVAVAVAVVPEALPAVVTISLAIGAQRMANRNALVRRLPVVESLGATTVICSDKTGTLTAGRMTATETWVGDAAPAGGRDRADADREDGQHEGNHREGRHHEGSDREGRHHEGSDREGNDLATHGEGTLTQRRRAMVEAAALCNDANLQRVGDEWRVHGDPTEGALLVAARESGIDLAALARDRPRIQEVAFSAERRRMTTVHRVGGGTVAYTKGGPEAVLAVCTHEGAAEGAVPLGGARREALEVQARTMAERGLRVMAVAQRENPDAAALADPAALESNLAFLGFVGLRDPPRPEAGAAIATCHAAGIRPVLITGDHPATGRAVARELGILRDGRSVSGAELDAMDDVALRRDAERIDVFARVSPAHKLRIVSALQANGHVVAMTGDGVNDAPALRKADVGVAMGITGTDVAKDAASMTLADDNFATIVAAVEEGRAIFDNVRKYLTYLLSTNFGEVALIAATLAFGLPLPLSAVQILYVNLASDGLPALALAVDPHEPDLMRRPPRRPGLSLLDADVLRLMLLGGLWSALANLAIFTWSLSTGATLQHAMTVTFVSLVLIQLAKAYVFRSERHSILVRPFANRWLNLAVAWEAALLVAIVYVPFLQTLFGTVPLAAGDWLAIAGAAGSVVPALEAAKAWQRRKARRDAAAARV